MRRQSALHDAVAEGDQARIMALLQDGADAEERDRYGWTALITAVSKDRVDCARLLLDHGADLHATSADGKTALHHAAMYGKTEAVRLLVRVGADVNAHDAFGSYTAMHLAAAHANRRIVTELCGVLLAGGARLDAKTKWGTTPLWSAAVSGRVELLEFLLRHGAEIDARDTQGRTPLIFVAKMGFFYDMVERLLTHGAGVNAQDAEGRTALMYAALYARQKLMDILLNGGADIGLQDANGATALMYASGEAPKMSEIGMLGREAGTVKEGGNASDWSPDKKAIRLAKAYNGLAEAIRHLLARGADTAPQDGEGRTALDVALENARTVGRDNAEVVAALRDHQDGEHRNAPNPRQR